MRKVDEDYTSPFSYGARSSDAPSAIYGRRQMFKEDAIQRELDRGWAMFEEWRLEGE
jgi:hypothetical protein